MIISRRTTLLAKLLLLLAIFITTAEISAAAESYARITREEYIDRYRHIAVEHQQRYGIPASITMAQGILESDSGNSYLSRKSNNHFGIKCKSDWRGRTVRHTDDAPNECFRAYDRVEHSYEDHAKFLDNSPRYDSLFNHSATDYKSWARGLKAAGYATAPDYAPRLVKIIEDNKLYLLDIEAVDGVKAYDKMLAERGDLKSREEPKPSGIDPNNYQISSSSYAGYSIYKCNRTRYVIARGDDSYKSIAKSFRSSARTIANYNDSSPTRKLTAGEVVYIERKQPRWQGNVKSHRVLANESLQSISQSYAISEKSLRKLNNFKRKDEVAKGATILLK
ncbi:MAG: glucosaminidase domain-containing protein [Rikenellaceae bacterium]